MDETAARVRTLVEEVIKGSELFVVDVELRGKRGSQAVSVFLDSDEGIGVDDLARISREIEFLLETEDVIAGAYRLNVSSPGADRPLTSPRQFRKNVERKLVVHFQTEDAGPTELVGTLRAVDDDAVELAVSEDDVRKIRMRDVVWAKVQLPW